MKLEALADPLPPDNITLQSTVRKIIPKSAIKREINALSNMNKVDLGRDATDVESNDTRKGQQSQ